ncbi:MAG: Helix-turn-helix domain protein [Berkelbacteria bacterium GW2011_GWA2_46_7]|uniref:Helix-turn-helix domain protein n=1 Tax=Berkelbacteria bacterium GW2011_GWA2_46_7 TaxID=1618335 RepID=A0A0G1QI86_9BACT|nr:MAG: Helix-turn-helix domain protein [Berkelbacteria bacterium GW2011_GWA2_46_7]
MNSLAERIKERRLARGISQEVVASELGISRPSYIAIEQGSKELTLSQLEKLANVLRTSISNLQYEVYNLDGDEKKSKKYLQIILNCLRSGTDKDGKITKTKLAKLAYLADFAWFYTNLEPMSGLAYRRIQQGPVPDEYFRSIDELFESGAVTLETKGPALMVSATETSAPRSELTNSEIGLIQAIARKWQGKPTADIVDFTHSQLPWKLCRPGEIIPYELITQEDPDNVY